MVQVDEPTRLQAFINNRPTYSDDFKALSLKLIQQGQSVEQVATLTGISQPTLYEWLTNWNKKRDWPDQRARTGRGGDLSAFPPTTRTTSSLTHGARLLVSRPDSRTHSTALCSPLLFERPSSAPQTNESLPL